MYCDWQKRQNNFLSFFLFSTKVLRDFFLLLVHFSSNQLSPGSSIGRSVGWFLIVPVWLPTDPLATTTTTTATTKTTAAKIALSHAPTNVVVVIIMTTAFCVSKKTFFFLFPPRCKKRSSFCFSHLSSRCFFLSFFHNCSLIPLDEWSNHGSNRRPYSVPRGFLPRGGCV